MNKYMELAYNESLKAYKKNEVPVGAIIVCNNRVIARAHNNRQTNNNVLGHAEVNVIIKAEKKLKDWRIEQCDLYVTLEPCDMCKKIIEEARIKNVYYLINRVNKTQNKEVNYIRTSDCDSLAEQYESKLKTFFEKLRK